MKLNFIKFLLAVEDSLGFVMVCDGGFYKVPAKYILYVSTMAAEMGLQASAAIENMETGEYWVDISPMYDL